jgi:hypothetical protein
MSRQDPSAHLKSVDTRMWVRIRAEGNWVEPEPGTPTESGLTDVRYEPGGPTGYRALDVVAFCTEDEEEAIVSLLTRYRQNGGYGLDPVCLHDRAFEVVHDAHCTLVALDTLAGALVVEADALLAETAP